MPQLSRTGPVAADPTVSARSSDCAGSRTPLCRGADSPRPRSEIRIAPVFRSLLYSQSWEDPDVDRRALDSGVAPIGELGRALGRQCRDEAMALERSRPPSSVLELELYVEQLDGRTVVGPSTVDFESDDDVVTFTFTELAEGEIPIPR